METLIITLLMTIFFGVSYLVYQQLSVGQISRGSILLDTSVLIDGRILDIARSGLLQAELIVPRSVVRELQFMADRADHDKRERARFGLEVIEKLQQIPRVKLAVKDDGITSQLGVDEQLINLAKNYNAQLCTVDYNLNKAARVQSIDVININELAQALRVVHLPGETIDVLLTQPGQDKQQGVGYLDDGTMVVVDDSREAIGKTVQVHLTRVLQTAAGRMMFAKRVSAKVPQANKHGAPPQSDKTKTKIRNGNTPAATEHQKNNERMQHSKNVKSKQNHVNTKRSSASSRTAPKRRQTPEDSLVDLANK